MTTFAHLAHARRAMRTAPATASSVLEPASMRFLVHEDNGGSYHWTIVAGGETLVRSASFAAYDEARKAARIVRDGASSASLEDGAAGAPPTAISARLDRATAQARLDAERWLDEGGSFSSEAVTQ